MVLVYTPLWIVLLAHADWLVQRWMASAIHLWEAEETKSQVDVNFQLFFVILKEIVKTYFFGYLCATYFHLTVTESGG